MAGITDLAFRLVCKEYGADIVYSEMVSAAGLRYNKQKTLKLINSTPADSPLFVQLFGSKPKDFVDAAKILNDLPKKQSGEYSISRPDGIDINFGCPVKKIIKQNSGCALMKNPDLAFEIIQAVCDNTDLPVSIKLRAGIGEYSALDFLEKVAPLPWRTAIVHGRTFRQGFSGPIDVALIKKIKKIYPHKTIIANGGIINGVAAREILEKTNADGLAIGRGSLGRPWIFEEIKAALKNKNYTLKNQIEIKSIALDHLEKVEKIFGPAGFFEFRKHLGWYFKNFPNAKEFRAKLFAAKDFTEVRKIINQKN